MAFAATLAGAPACGATVASVDSSTPVVAFEMRAVETQAGHPIVLVIDPRITRGHSSDEVTQMTVASARAIEGDLVALKRDHPEVFARTAAHLERVELRYGDGGDHPIRSDGETIVITRLFRWELVEPGDVASGLVDTFYADLEKRFGALQPEQVAAPDRSDYLLYLRHAREVGRGPAADAAFAKAVRLAAVVGAEDPKLAGDLRDWLFAASRDVVDRLRHGNPDPSTGPWVAWLGRTLPTATPANELQLADAVLDQSVRPPGDDVLPGFDAFAFGLRIADVWAAAGHPVKRVEGDPQSSLFDDVLAPPTYEGAEGSLSRGDGKFSMWLWSAFASDAQTQRLVDALAARNDPALVRVVVYHLDGPEGDRRDAILQALERAPRVLQQTLRAFAAEERGNGCDEGLADEANRAWRTPALRGTALHVLACRHGPPHGSGDDFFRDFGRLYGGEIGPDVLAAFLDDSPDAIALAPAVWPALSKGWSRAGVVDARIGAFLGLKRVRDNDGGEPIVTLRELERRLCGDGDAEVARFHATLASLARTGDAETARSLAAVVDETQPGRCPKPGG